jgi:hypothetical protein
LTEGKLVENRVNFDGLGMLQQLGVIRDLDQSG